MSRYVEVAFNLPLKRCFTYSLPDGLEAGVGVRVSAPFGKRCLVGCVVAEPAQPPDGVSEIRGVQRAVDKRPLFGEQTLELARWLSEMYMCSLGEALFGMLPGGKRETETEELPLDEDARDYHLSDEQITAVSSLSQRSAGMYYLQGVTGSGKTDVFLRTAQNAVSRGKGVIYLVPEITLTHQIVRVFRAAFKDRLAVLHSALTPSQRLREWQRVRDGEVSVAIGARSAVFAPFAQLGLIVIDEEHEGAYKSNSTPRYHARQVAMYRAAKENAVLLMGSATPSVEAYHRMQVGKLERFLLPVRMSGGAMPRIEIVDMRTQQGPLSAPLVSEIALTRSQGRQTILFLNRRGFSYFFHCKSCGYQMNCRHCSVALTYHKDRGRMICHYCGYAVPPMESCPQCGSLDVGYSGFGTEGIEQELAGLFPGIAVRRIDTDSVKKRSALREALADFRDGKTEVLIGTQMVAKGLNFPGVKLVGIINADTGLQLPDFRAAERTFNLLVQVSGRAGRSLPDGKVIIQTYQPENPAIVFAQRGQLEEFYAREIQVRNMLGFPPFSRLIRVVTRGKSRDKVVEAIAGIADAARPALGAHGDILGPAECPIARISGSYRHHVIIRAHAFSAAHTAVAAVMDHTRLPSGVYAEIDVDPQSLL